jgi:hypothetical protein
MSQESGMHAQIAEMADADGRAAPCFIAAF